MRKSSVTDLHCLKNVNNSPNVETLLSDPPESDEHPATGNRCFVYELLTRHVWDLSIHVKYIFTLISTRTFFREKLSTIPSVAALPDNAFMCHHPSLDESPLSGTAEGILLECGCDTHTNSET